MTHINFQHAKFMLSAAKHSQLPEDEGAEVAFAGRSNAGKSSALNTLTHNKNLARTSKTPGRTQLLNFFSISENIRLVDLPGYGYAKVPLAVKQGWQQTLEDYFNDRNSLKGIILLMDIRHPMKAFDMQMLEFANYYRIPIHILLTKADKLSRNQQLLNLNQVKKLLTNNKFQASIQLFSSLKRTGVDNLKKQLNHWLSEDR